VKRSLLFKALFDNCGDKLSHEVESCPALYILYMYVPLHISCSWNGFNQLYCVCVIDGWIKSVFFGWHRFYLVYLQCYNLPVPYFYCFSDFIIFAVTFKSNFDQINFLIDDRFNRNFQPYNSSSLYFNLVLQMSNNKN